MEIKSVQTYRRWAYIFFGLTLLAFGGGLIPAMFMGNIVLTGISGTVVLVSALLSLLTGRVGFKEVEQAAPKAAIQPKAATPAKAIHYTPLDPDQITFDDTTWLYTRGGGTKSKHPDQHPL